MRLSVSGVLLFVVALAATSVTWAQTPGTPPAEQAQESPQQPSPQSQPTQPEQPQPSPLQQYLIQQPGRPPLTPAIPPNTTLPPWTPPVPPPPSQTNIPAPFPGAGPLLPGRPAFVGAPGFTIPGALAPTVARIPGGTLELHPTLHAAEEYSDNFFETTSGAAENFRSVFGPGVLLLLNGARTFGTVAATVDLAHDTADNSGDEVKVFPSLAGTVRYALTPRLALTLSDVFLRNDEPGVADQFGIRRGRQIFDSNNMTAQVDWILDRIATQAYYRNVLFANEGSLQNQTLQNQTQQNQTGTGSVDTDTNIFGVNATTRIATSYLVRGGYEFSSTDAINGGSTSVNTTSHTGFASIAREIGLYGSAGVRSSYSYQTQANTKIWNGALFGAYGIPTGLSLYGAVGYSLLNSDTQTNQGTVYANATASYRFTRAFIAVGALRDFQQTGQQGQNFGTVQTSSYFGSFLYQFTPFINAMVQVNYSENQGTGTGNTQNSGTLKTLTYGGDVNWLVLRWLTASLRYAYIKQTGSGSAFSAFSQGVPTGDFAENRVTLNLFATF